MQTITILSFGFGHPAGAPEATVLYDLRHHFRDPHVLPELRYMTACDTEVRVAVRTTPGIPELLAAAASTVKAYALGPSGDRPLTVAVGCAGGRHRAPTFAMDLAAALEGDFAVDLVHRDIELDVIER